MGNQAEAVNWRRGEAGQPALVVFGGLSNGFALPSFEFSRLLADLGPITHVQVRDLTQSWYQAGVPGLGDDLRSSAAALAATLAPFEASRVVYVGNSAGGFGALAFGAVMPDTVDSVIAFSPQTNLAKTWRARYRDRRWPAEVDLVHAITGADNPLLDLRRYGLDRSRTRIYFSAGNPLDAAHALRLAGHARLHPRWSRSHNLVKELRDNGRLLSLLREHLYP